MSNIEIWLSSLSSVVLVEEENERENNGLFGYLDAILCLSKLLGVICCLREMSVVVFFW